MMYETLLAVFLLVFGVVNCFAGRRIFKSELSIIGFLFGLYLVHYFLYPHLIGVSYGQWITLSIGLVGGFLLARLFRNLVKLALFAVGAALGLLLAQTFFVLDGIVAIVVSLAFAIVAGILAVTLETITIVLASALGGAWLVVASLASLTGRHAIVLAPHAVSVWTGRPVGGRGLTTPVAWLLLAILGVLVQWLLLRPRRKRDEKDH